MTSFTSWSAPAWALRPERAGVEEIAGKLARAPVAAGAEELSIGALPVGHRIDYQLPAQFLSGRVPIEKDAIRLLGLESISHPQLATQRIALACVLAELVGAGRGLSDAERKKVVDRADLMAQEVQDLVARQIGRLLLHVNFETKGLTLGGLQAGATGGDLKGVPTPTVSDVIEHTIAFVMGEAGSASMQMEGPGVETFGSFPDEARVLMVGTHINPKMETDVLKRNDAKTVDEFLDPELPVDQLVRRVAKLNGVHSSQVDVTILTADDTDMQALAALQQTYRGMRVYRVKAGTVVPSLAAVLGVKDNRIRLFLRRSGITEAVYMAILAGVFSADGSYVNFRVVSEQVKSEFSKRYDWLQHVLQQMKVLRPDDWEAIRDGKIIFSSRSVIQPVVGAYTFLTNGRTDLNLSFPVNGVRQGGGVSSVYTLAFTSNPHPRKKQGGFLWGSQDEYRIPVVTAAGAEEVRREILTRKATAVISVPSVDEALAAGRLVAELGIPPEITFRGKQADVLEVIRILSKELSPKGIPVLSGSVLTAEQARLAVGVGARALVSPGFVEEVVREARALKVLLIPAVGSPEEAIHARREGFTLLKLFPFHFKDAADYVKALKAPMPLVLHALFDERIQIHPSGVVGASSPTFSKIYKHLIENKAVETFELPPVQGLDLAALFQNALVAEGFLDVQFMPTGGVMADEILDIIGKHGIAAVGLSVGGSAAEIGDKARKIAKAITQAAGAEQVFSLSVNGEVVEPGASMVVPAIVAAQGHVEGWGGNPVLRKAVEEAALPNPMLRWGTEWIPVPGHPDQVRVASRLGPFLMPQTLLAEPGLLARVQAEVRNMERGLDPERIIHFGMGGSAEAGQALQQSGLLRRVPAFVFDTSDPHAVAESMPGEPSALRKFLQTSKINIMSMGMTSEEPLIWLAWLGSVAQQMGISLEGQISLLTLDGSSVHAYAREMGLEHLRVDLQPDSRQESAGRMSGPVTTRFPLWFLGLNGYNLNKSTRQAALAPEDQNRFVALGQTIAELAERGKNKVTLVLPTELEFIGPFLKQGWEESLGLKGKEGLSATDPQHRIKIVIDEPLDPAFYGTAGESDRVFLVLKARNARLSAAQRSMLAQLRRQGHSVLSLSSWRHWQNLTLTLMQGNHLAVAAVGARWNRQFVNQPGVEAYKAQAKKMIIAAMVNGGFLEKTDVASDGSVAADKYFSALVRWVLREDEAQGSIFGTQGYKDIFNTWTTYSSANEEIRLTFGGSAPRSFWSKSDAADALGALIESTAPNRIEVGNKVQHRPTPEIIHFGDTRFTDAGRSMWRVLQKAATDLFRRPLKTNVDVGEGPRILHEYHEAHVNEPGGISILLVPEDHGPPPMGRISNHYIWAQALATHQALIEAGRTSVIIRYPRNDPQGRKMLVEFFDQAARGFPSAAGVDEIAANAIPHPEVSGLRVWADQLTSADPLYGWLTELPVDEREGILQTVAHAYGLFGDHMLWAAQYILDERAGAGIIEKIDKSHVTSVEQEVQRRLNILIRGIPNVSGVGEEGNEGDAGSTRFWVFSDPVDGTTNYLRPDSHPRAGYYSSPLTMVYRDDNNHLHPVLTLVALPRYVHNGRKGLMEVTGLGIDGVLVNGRLLKNTSARLLSDLIATTVVLAGAGKERYNRETGAVNISFRTALENVGHPLQQIQGDSENMTPFLMPLGVEDPTLSGIHPVGPSSLWDTVPGLHLVQAIGGEVYRLDRKEPFRLTSESASAEAKLPPLLYSTSSLAAEELLSHFTLSGVEEGRGVGYVAVEGLVAVVPPWAMQRTYGVTVGLAQTEAALRLGTLPPARFIVVSAGAEEGQAIAELGVLPGQIVGNKPAAIELAGGLLQMAEGLHEVQVLDAVARTLAELRSWLLGLPAAWQGAMAVGVAQRVLQLEALSQVGV